MVEAPKPGMRPMSMSNTLNFGDLAKRRNSHTHSARPYYLLLLSTLAGAIGRIPTRRSTALSFGPIAGGKPGKTLLVDREVLANL